MCKLVHEAILVVSRYLSSFFRKFYRTFFWDTCSQLIFSKFFIGHFFGTPTVSSFLKKILSDIFLGHIFSYRTFFWDIFFLSDIFLGHFFSYRTIFWDIFFMKWFYRTHFWDTFWDPKFSIWTHHYAFNPSCDKQWFIEWCFLYLQNPKLNHNIIKRKTKNRFQAVPE